MHPFAFAPGCGHSRTPQICEVPGNLGLRYIQNLNQVAHADLPAMHEIKQAKAGSVGERPEQTFQMGRRFRHGAQTV